MTRISAAIVWLILGIAASTGCIPIIVPAVQQDITTGEKLRAIDFELKRATLPNSSGAYTEAKYQSLSADQCRELRRRLIAGPPSMFACVYAESGTTQENYSGFNPGMYEPEDRERIALSARLTWAWLPKRSLMNSLLRQVFRRGDTWCAMALRQPSWLSMFGPNITVACLSGMMWVIATDGWPIIGFGQHRQSATAGEATSATQI